jgi:hypothetical protein
MEYYTVEICPDKYKTNTFNNQLVVGVYSSEEVAINAINMHIAKSYKNYTLIKKKKINNDELFYMIYSSEILGVTRYESFIIKSFLLDEQL